MGAVADVKGREKQSVASFGLRETLLASVAVMLIGCAIFLTVWRRVAFVNAGYEIRVLEKKTAKLHNQKRAMEIEKEMLSNPVRIEEFARKRLGLAEPLAGQIRIVR